MFSSLLRTLNSYVSSISFYYLFQCIAVNTLLVILIMIYWCFFNLTTTLKQIIFLSSLIFYSTVMMAINHKGNRGKVLPNISFYLCLQ